MHPAGIEPAQQAISVRWDATRVSEGHLGSLNHTTRPRVLILIFNTSKRITLFFKCVHPVCFLNETNENIRMNTRTQVEIVLSSIVMVMAIGTLAYNSLEGWNYVDSFYFTGMTVTTVGYGDLHPTTGVSKIFTVFFAFAGVGIALFALTTFTSSYFEHRERNIEKTFQRRIVNILRESADPKNIRKRKNEIIEGSKL